MTKLFEFLNLSVVRDFLYSIATEGLKEYLKKEPEEKAKSDLLSLHNLLYKSEKEAEVFVGSLGELASCKSENLEKEKQKELLNLVWKNGDALRSTLEKLYETLEVIAPKLSIYKYETLHTLFFYISARTGLIAALESEVHWIRFMGYRFEIIRELYIQSLENLGHIKHASREIREFISEHYNFRDLY